MIVLLHSTGGLRTYRNIQTVSDSSNSRSKIWDSVLHSLGWMNYKLPQFVLALNIEYIMIMCV